MSYQAIATRVVRTINGASREDRLAVEAPLEIRLGYGPRDRRRHMVLAITMRTPGHDEDLATGFLIGEGLIGCPDQLASVGPCGEPGESIRVELSPDVAFDPDRLARHFYTSSSCGVCGKTALDAISVSGGRDLKDQELSVSARVLQNLPGALSDQQPGFRATGGLHAAALFGPSGELAWVREDVGRHNALDKLVGAAAREKGLPLTQWGLLLSGRASFELVQKAVMAGIPLVAAIGAPSSLAVEAADRFGITLAAFLRKDGGNVYCHPSRVVDE